MKLKDSKLYFVIWRSDGAILMRQFLALTRALGDAHRVRSLMALRDRELCLCQIIELLGLSPSTVSRHIGLLQKAGLVVRRKAGRWHYYRLPGRDAPPEVTGVIRWVVASLRDDATISSDEKKLRRLLDEDPSALCDCYRS